MVFSRFSGDYQRLPVSFRIVLCGDCQLPEYCENGGGRRVGYDFLPAGTTEEQMKEIGDKIREYDLAGVKVDEDFKRYYPYETLASKVLGFTGGDNQGIIGLEVKYEKYLKGQNGMILTTTDARGIELDGIAEDRIEPVPGNTLQLSIDYNIQKYAEQAAQKVMEEKQADGVSILLMNPQNGEILAMVNVPEFNLNDPFTLTEEFLAANAENSLQQI